MKKKDYSNQTFVTPPITRVPIKTNLTEVLLLTNPWVQRDLDKKLAHISKDQKRRAKTLEWTQRHFFIQQIFDSDYSLRFTKQRESFTEKTKSSLEKKPNMVERLVENPGRDAKLSVRADDWNSPTHGESNGRDLRDTTKVKPMKESPKLPALIPTAQGAGIFLPSRREKKRKLSKCLSLDSCSSDNTRLREADDKTTVHGSYTDECISNCSKMITFPVINSKAKSVNGELLSGPVLERSTRRSNGGGTILEKPRNFRKSISLPRIAINNFPTSVDSDSVKSTHIDKTPGKQQSDSLQVRKSSDNETKMTVSSHTSQDGEGDIISSITARLPHSLMIKANQQVNKVIVKRKNKWIRKSKKVNENRESLLADPRYENLAKVLHKAENGETTSDPEYDDV